MNNKWLLFILLSTQFSWACFAPPHDIKRAPEALVYEASTILVVEAVPIKSSDEKCDFKIVEVLKGHGREFTGLTCKLPKNNDLMTDFNGHKDQAFWSGNGRLGINADCSLSAPAFSIRKKYLVFAGISPDTKQYEDVSNIRDEWLLFVKSKLAVKNN